jgi:hypothetical protein
MKSPKSLLVFITAVFLAMLSVVLIRRHVPSTSRIQVQPDQSNASDERTVTHQTNFGDLATVIVTNTTPFDWSMIASEDLKRFVANLRQVGCPEQTIRDIIIAIVDRKYKPRMAALKVLPKSKEYWKKDYRSTPPQDAEKQKQLMQVENERKAILAAVFGGDPEEANRTLAEGRDMKMNSFAYLPDEKQSAIREMTDAFAKKMNERLQELAKAETPATKLKAEMKKLRQEHETDLAKILNPKEFDDYQLRTSDTASRLHWDLKGFSPTEDEFRDLFRLQKSFDDQYGDSGENDSITKEKVAEAKSNLEAQINMKLGDQRFADYQRSRDNLYQHLLDVADRYDLPTETAIKGYDIKTAAERQRQAILSQTELSVQDRQLALQTLQEATKENLAQILGERPLRALQQRGGDYWLKNLSSPSAPSATGPQF